MNKESMTTPLYAVNARQVRSDFAEKRRCGLRAKDAAQALGLPEGAVIAAHVGAHDLPLTVVPLKSEWLDLLKALKACGTVMALTRNESTVHEKTGIYQKLSAQGQIGLALSREIDLRIFFAHWHAGFAVTEMAANPQRPSIYSLQFFDAHGVAVHKVFAREETDLAAWNALVERFAQPEADAAFCHALPRESNADDVTIDREGLRAAWAAMQDTHEFFDMLKRFGAERQQAFRMVHGEFTERLPNSTTTQLLNDAALDAVSIMVFVPSPGCIQIHTGPVHNIQPLDTPSGVRWINVMDPGFNLHLRTDLIGATWVVHKPTADGIVTSVEVFDTHGDLMAMFFGERKPGRPELESWRDLVARLPRVLNAEELAA